MVPTTEGMAIPRRAYLLLLVLPCFILHRAAAAQPADEAQLLLQIKRAWGDLPALAAWNGTGTGAHCVWPYVRCDPGGRVTELSLANLNARGPIPDAIGGLSSLSHLDVSNNYIVGGFRTALYRCASLRYLNLSQNYLDGELPADIGRGLGQNLTTLDLNGNEFNGTIPASLSGLRNLRFLALQSNHLSGTIPNELGELTNLETLMLADNPFDTGRLPASFKNLTKLTVLWAAQCNLVGDFPSYVVGMPELQTLALYTNALSGSIPPGVWGLKKLREMMVYGNNLTGDMFTGNIAAMSLAIVDVSDNKLTGTIPEGFGRLENLTYLFLFRNNFSGEIPVNVGRLPSLEILRLDNNRFNGTLPPELGKHSLGLSYIEADDNELTGAIPDGLCDNGQFRSLTASRNRLNGSIPAGLANCATLNDLQLDNNQLSGEVPEALWTATQLGFVLLQNNRLTGSLPSTMFTNLETLHIGSNQFRGSLPAIAVSLQDFTAENNQFSGEIPGNMGTGMPLLQALSLSGNQLSGRIPWSFSRLSYLTQMDLSKNLLTGEIPPELGAMLVLKVLDLSSNKLSGNIPAVLVKLELSSLNLSSNRLSGQVPAGLAVAAYDHSFLDNPSLCTAAALGSRYLVGVRTCASSGGVSPALRTGLLAAGAMLLLIFVAFAFFVVHDVKTRRRLAKTDDEWRITPFQALDFGDAVIPRRLVEENLIGRGGSGRVYRVTYTNRYNGNTGVVAVKQIQCGEALDEKLEREFESEARILGNVRHNNIVKLLCCISSAESKLLVYDYMDNGSLDKWLHSHGDCGVEYSMVRRSPFEWPTRLRVAVGAAQGLCYMHHECSPPIVHRDVTSNILLDSEFRAKVADFGLARLLGSGAPDTMSAVAGSIGYMAPEYAYTRKVNQKVDVYSFGVVLLELTTGKNANDGGEYGCLAEWARHQYRSGESIPEATDKCIRFKGYLDEIETVFKLGVKCTGNSPSSRPTMKDVLQILLKCSEQTHQKSRTERGPEYEAAPLLLPQRGSHRKQLSNDKGIVIEEKNDFGCIV